MSRRWMVLAFGVVMFAVPTTARADFYVGPGIGIAFGSRSAQGLANFVLDACWLYQEPIGVDVDVTFAPNFFDNQVPYGNNGVTTVMGNVMVAAREPGPRLPRGLHRGRTVRPYLSGGLGWIRENVGVAALSHTDLGTNVGVGILSMGSSQIGVRGDLRYFRDLVGSSEGSTSSIDFGGFHFWRGSITIMFRF